MLASLCRMEACLVFELAVCNGVIGYIVPDRPTQCLFFVSAQSPEGTIALQPDGILAVVLFTSLVKLRSGEAAVTSKVQRQRRVLTAVVLNQRSHELPGSFSTVLCAVAELCFQEVRSQSVKAQDWF